MSASRRFQPPTAPADTGRVTHAATPDLRALAAEAEVPAATASRDDREVLVIEPRRGRGPFVGLDRRYLRELVAHRELLYFLVWRDVKVRYKMAALGVTWAAAVPLVSTLIYGFFTRAAGFAEGIDVPWLLIISSAIVPWMFLQKSISEGGQSLVNNQQLLSKIYLPRVFIPAASAGTALVDMAMALLITALFGLGYLLAGSYTPTWQLLAVVPLVPLTFVAGVATSVGLGGLTVLYRDIRFIIPFLTQFGLWLSGVIIPLDQVAGDYLWVAAINPYAGIVSAWRSAICGTPWQPELIAGSLILIPIMLVAGVAYFRRVERRFADIS